LPGISFYPTTQLMPLACCLLNAHLAGPVIALPALLPQLALPSFQDQTDHPSHQLFRHYQLVCAPKRGLQHPDRDEPKHNHKKYNYYNHYNHQNNQNQYILSISAYI
jgi:hypothetical protein